MYFVSKITKKTSEHHPLDGYFFELINQKRYELADMNPPTYPMTDFHLLDASFGALPTLGDVEIRWSDRACRESVRSRILGALHR